MHSINTVAREKYLKLLIISAILIVIILRRPELLSTPRFWAEEGSTFFADAFNNGSFANLLSVHYGYFTLYNNLATSLAALFPLETAPLVTTWLALGVQTAASALVIFGHFTALPHLWQKTAVALLIQLLAYSGIWLNTIGVQFFLAVMTFLILMFAVDRRSPCLAAVHGAILVLSGLTGVISCFMLPVFIYKYLRTKAKALAVYAGILAASLLLQLAVFCIALLGNDPEVGLRLVKNDAARLIIKTISFQFAAPFFGHLLLTTPEMETAGFALRKVIFSLTGFDNFRSESQVITFLAGSVLLTIMAALLCRRRSEPEARYLSGLLLIIIPLSTVLSVQMSSGPRYVYVPSIIMMYFICSCLGEVKFSSGVRGAALLLLGFSLACNSYEYRRSITDTAYSTDWLPWKDEVRKWRQYDSYELAIWPPPWRMNLRKSAVRSLDR